MTGDGLVGKLGRFLTKVVAPAVPAFKTADLLVAVVAVTADSRLFGGLFGAWIQLPSEWVPHAAKALGLGNPDDVSAALAQTSEDEGEGLREAAIKKKAQRDYSESARLFSRAASAFAAAGTEITAFEAANAHSEAAKCYGVLKQVEYARKANLESAVIYERYEKSWVRAAAIYEKVGNEERERGDLIGALGYLDKALALYRNTGDGRAYHVDTMRVDLLSTLGRYGDAIALYEVLSAHAVTVPTLKFSVRSFLSNALFCTLALQDQAALQRSLTRYVDEYPLFADVEPAWRMLVQAWIAGDAEFFEMAEQKVRMLNTVAKGSWQDQSIALVKESLTSLC
ncbi:soluble NSF attachment protein [Chytriomyces sp. MP71]|nr:soluble NSF attachment protein [Chytriomyces sp. MP71]